MTTSLIPTTAAPAPLPACTRLARVFQDPLLEEPAGALSPAERRTYAELMATAGAACRSCPLVTDCLYRAVVEHDVAGYAAGTTARQRSEIRRRLGVTVRPEDLDTMAGVVGGHRQVDHAEVLRLRAAHPDESLETIAGRLGCSLSTVKRHLRRERNAPAVPLVRGPRPRLDQVLAAAADVAAGGRTRGRAA